MKIALFFGSFNPIHIGHLIIAQQLLNKTDIDKIWFVISPQNPLKDKTTLLSQHERLHLVHLAIEDNPKLKASDVEFHLPSPNYTIDTLSFLSQKYPKHEFSLILGADNLRSLHKWKNFEKIIANYKIYIYRRPGYAHNKNKLKNNCNILYLDVPLLDISATMIRQMISDQKSIQYLVHSNITELVQNNRFYKNKKS